MRSDEATASGSETAPAPRRRHVLLAGVLVLAAMVGVSAIRTVDVQPAPAEEFDVAPADATATIETAIERTGERDLIIDQTTDHWNDTTGAWMEGTRRQALLQRSDRSARYYADAGDVGDDRDRAIYATDGRLAMLHDPTPPASPGPHHVAIERRSWTILIGPPYGWGIEDRFAWPPADADWRLAEASDEVLVYESDDPSTLADHGLESVPDVPGDVALGEESGATIVIDRDLLTVRRATVTVDYVDDRDGASERVATRWEQRVIEIGDVTASRPGSVGPPSPPARLWDVVYY